MPGRLAQARRKFEADPGFQTRFHLIFTYIWLINLVIVPFVFFLASTVWAKYSLFYVLEVSLYANFATDYDGVSSSEASGHAQNAEEHLDQE
jgi:hypothetical protein